MRELWNTHLQPLKIPEPLSDQAFFDLERLYEENGRFYHTLDHIQFVLTKIEEIGNAQDLNTLRLAVWFHDVIYDPQAHDNEEQSAQYAREVLLDLGLGKEQVTAVTNLIQATTHKELAKENDTKILLDADLAILAANPGIFDQYCLDIRKEYAHVPIQIYRPARRILLQNFIQREHIYQTVHMRKSSEKRARKNLEREIERL